VVEGDVLDGSRVGEAVSGAGAVLAALGHAKGSPEDLQAQGTRRIVDAMGEHGVRRLISLTGAGVRDEEDRPKVSDRAIVALLGRLQPAVLEDGRRHAEMIRESGLDWTIVRAPRLTDGPHTGKHRVGYVGRESGTRISRADVADFMLGQLEDGRYVGRMPMVSY
jgi:putative NADH-flavin reductase